MSVTAFAVGIAQLLNDAGIGVWDDARTFTDADTDVAIVLRKVPQTPTKLISLTAYTVLDDPSLNDTTVGVQFRLRGDTDPDTVQAIDEAIFNVLEGLHDTTVNGVPLGLMWRQSGLPLPQDQNQRWEQTSSYYARIAVPTLYRTD